MATKTVPGRFSIRNLGCSYPRAASILGAIVATLTIWAVSTFAGQADLTVNGSEIGPFDVVLATLIAGLTGWGLLAFLERKTNNAWTRWRNIAIAAVVISMLGPLSAEDTMSRTVLSIMHAFAGAIIIKGFSRTIPARRPSGE